MLPLSLSPRMLKNFSRRSPGWEAGEYVLITWFSIADKQDDLYQVHAAPALTNQRAAFICVLQSE